MTKIVVIFILTDPYLPNLPQVGRQNGRQTGRVLIASFESTECRLQELIVSKGQDLIKENRRYKIPIKLSFPEYVECEHFEERNSQ